MLLALHSTSASRWRLFSVTETKKQTTLLSCAGVFEPVSLCPATPVLHITFLYSDSALFLEQSYTPFPVFSIMTFCFSFIILLILFIILEQPDSTLDLCLFQLPGLAQHLVTHSRSTNTCWVGRKTETARSPQNSTDLCHPILALGLLFSGLFKGEPLIRKTLSKYQKSWSSIFILIQLHSVQIISVCKLN